MIVAGFLRPVCFGLVLNVFFTNVLFAYKPEINLWEERRAPSRPLHSNPALPRLNPVANSKSTTPALSAYGSVRRTLRPVSSNGKSVFLIQDVHLNSEAQANIAQAIRELSGISKIDFIAVEGAFGPIDLSRLLTFPDQETVKDVAGYMFRQKKISGPVYAALSGKTPPLIGVDDAGLYSANVRAYRAAALFIDANKKRHQDETTRLNERKFGVFNIDLLAFDSHVQRRRDGVAGLPEILARMKSYEGARSLKAPQIDCFLKASALESSLRFDDVESEQEKFFETLWPRLSSAEKRGFLLKSRGMQTGELSPMNFYADLKKLCLNWNPNWADYPSFNAYLDYVTLAGKVDGEKLFDETVRLETAVYESLARTPEEKELVNEGKQNYLIGKLWDFSLTREEWNEYKGNRQEGVLSPFEEFYALAEKRDEAMAANLLREMDRRGATSVVLVTGGFHSSGIARRVTESGATFVSFVPRITNREEALSGAGALSIFTQEKTPLEKIFKGEKLFLSPETWTPLLHFRFSVYSALRRILVGQEKKANADGAKRDINDLYGRPPKELTVTRNGRHAEARFNGAEVHQDIDQNGRIASIDETKTVHRGGVYPNLLLYNLMIFFGVMPSNGIKGFLLLTVPFEARALMGLLTFIGDNFYLQVAMLTTLLLLEYWLAYYGHRSHGAGIPLRSVFFLRGVILGTAYLVFFPYFGTTAGWWTSLIALSSLQILMDAVVLFWENLINLGMVHPRLKLDPESDEFFVDGLTLNSERVRLNTAPFPGKLDEKTDISIETLRAELAMLDENTVRGEITQPQIRRRNYIRANLPLFEEKIPKAQAAFANVLRHVPKVAVELGLNPAEIESDLKNKISVAAAFTRTRYLIPQFFPSRYRWGRIRISRSRPVIFVALNDLITLESKEDLKMMAFALIFAREWQREYASLGVSEKDRAPINRYPSLVHNRMREFENKWDLLEKPYRSPFFRSIQFFRALKDQWILFKMSSEFSGKFLEIKKEYETLEKTVGAIMSLCEDKLTGVIDRLKGEAHRPMRLGIGGVQTEYIDLIGEAVAFGDYNTAYRMIQWGDYLFAVDTGSILMNQLLVTLRVLARTRHYKEFIDLLTQIKNRRITLTLGGPDFYSPSHYYKTAACWRAHGFRQGWHYFLNGNRRTQILDIALEEVTYFINTSSYTNFRGWVENTLGRQAEIVRSDHNREIITDARTLGLRLFDEISETAEKDRIARDAAEASKAAPSAAFYYTARLLLKKAGITTQPWMSAAIALLSLVSAIGEGVFIVTIIGHFSLINKLLFIAGYSFAHIFLDDLVNRKPFKEHLFNFMVHVLIFSLYLIFAPFLILPLSDPLFYLGLFPFALHWGRDAAELAKDESLVELRENLNGDLNFHLNDLNGDGVAVPNKNILLPLEKGNAQNFRNIRRWKKRLGEGKILFLAPSDETNASVLRARFAGDKRIRVLPPKSPHIFLPGAFDLSAFSLVLAGIPKEQREDLVAVIPPGRALRGVLSEEIEWILLESWDQAIYFGKSSIQSINAYITSLARKIKRAA